MTHSVKCQLKVKPESDVIGDDGGIWNMPDGRIPNEDDDDDETTKLLPFHKDTEVKCKDGDGSTLMI